MSNHVRIPDTLPVLTPENVVRGVQSLLPDDARPAMEAAREAAINWKDASDEKFVADRLHGPKRKPGAPIAEDKPRRVTCMRRAGVLDEDAACGKCRRCRRRASMRLWRERNQDGG